MRDHRVLTETSTLMAIAVLLGLATTILTFS
jgi:hypothetical protein